MIGSPHKNLGQGGHCDAEFAGSVAVADLYMHLHDWLSRPRHGQARSQRELPSVSAAHARPGRSQRLTPWQEPIPLPATPTPSPGGASGGIGIVV